MRCSSSISSLKLDQKSQTHFKMNSFSSYQNPDIQLFNFKSRFLPPAYNDGIQSVRKSVTGRHLPSAREITDLIHEDKDAPLSSVTHMLMQWGQFVDHDITGVNFISIYTSLLQYSIFTFMKFFSYRPEQSVQWISTSLLSAKKFRFSTVGTDGMSL